MRFKNIFYCTRVLNTFKNVKFRNYSAKVVPLTGGNKWVVLNEETLTGRILTYLNTNKELKIDTKFEPIAAINNIKNNNTLHLQHLTIDELINLFQVLKEFETIYSKLEFVRVLNTLNLEFCARLSILRAEDILKIFNAYMNVISNRIIDYKFYKTSLNVLSVHLEELNRSELIETFFYVSLQKNTREAQIIIRKCLKYLNKTIINDLSVEELCIICNATFKTSIKINNKPLLKKINNYINDNLSILKDPALFITLIKTLRQNRYQDDNLLSSISSTIFFNKTSQYYSFGAICHILALFSDYLYYDEDLLNHFNTICLSELEKMTLKSKNTYLTKYIRGKDIKRYLWALSNLGYKGITNDLFKSVIIPKLLDKIHAREFTDDCDSLVEILLYLWIMNYQAVEIIPFALTDTCIKKIRESKTRAKHRLNLLLSCIYFENRQLFKQLNVKPQGSDNFNIKVDMQKRPIFMRVLDNLKYITAKSEINKFEPNYQIPYLNIVGITGYKKNVYKSVNIEVLDNYICVKNKDNHPSGPMQLKLRILEQFDEGLIVIHEDEINEMTESELQEFLIEELNFVCC